MDTEEIKKKRNNLRMTIRGNMQNLEKNPKLLDKIKQKVATYNDLTDQLIKLGYNVSIQTDYLTKSYWDSYSTKNVKKQTNSTNWEKVATELKRKLKEKSTNNNYIITLAWTETNKESPSKSAIESIQKYFESMQMKQLDTDFSDMGYRKEYMIKYEYVGEDNSFNIIKNSAQFMLDELSATDYDKFNIAIFGKKIS